MEQSNTIGMKTKLPAPDPVSFDLHSTKGQGLGLNLSYDGQVRACSPRNKVLQCHTYKKEIYAWKRHFKKANSSGIGSDHGDPDSGESTKFTFCPRQHQC